MGGCSRDRDSRSPVSDDYGNGGDQRRSVRWGQGKPCNLSARRDTDQCQEVARFDSPGIHLYASDPTGLGPGNSSKWPLELQLTIQAFGKDATSVHLVYPPREGKPVYTICTPNVGRLHRPGDQLRWLVVSRMPREGVNLHAGSREQSAQQNDRRTAGIRYEGARSGRRAGGQEM